MKNSFLKLCATAFFATLSAGMVGQAGAQVVVVPHVGSVQVMHDAAGIPIWGYGTRGRAIYAYSPEGLPVYAFERVYSGCYVPTWDFLPSYHGPRWPKGIHRQGHQNFRPRPGAPGPIPGGHKPGPDAHGPAAHKPGLGSPGAHKPQPGGQGPAAHKPAPGGKQPAGKQPGGQPGNKPGGASRR